MREQEGSPRFTPLVGLCVIIGLALVFRLWLAASAPSPGIADPTYYYNVARNVAAGRGFVSDFIWHFHRLPPDVTHPTDYYPPLASVLAALSMRLSGDSVFAALLPSVLFGGAVLPLLGYFLAGRMALAPGARLFSAGAIAFIPELVLNSARTDTTIFFTAFGSFSLVSMAVGLADPGVGRRGLWLAGSGAAAGLAYLTRLDGLLLVPAFLAAAVAFALMRKLHMRPVHALAFLGMFGLVVAPWLIRNQIVLGTVFPVRLGQTMFVTNVLDLFSYGRTFTLESYLAWGWGNILGKIAFEALGNAKMLITLHGVAAPLVLAGGVLMLQRRSGESGERPYLALLIPAGIFLAGLYVYYTVLTPFFSQSGSFKKTAMTLIPFAVALAAWAVERITQARARRAVMIAVCALLAFYALDLVRADFALIQQYDAHLSGIVQAVREAGDANGDGRTIVMAQDPFQWNYYGFSAVMLPNDPRDLIFEAARRYQVDYFIFPADRAALDAVQYDEEDDPHLALVWQYPRQRTRLYRFVP